MEEISFLTKVDECNLPNTVSTNFRVRRAAHWVVNLRYFDAFIMVVISLSSITLAAEDPVVEDSVRNDVLDYFDHIFTSVFAVEMVLKVLHLCMLCLNNQLFKFVRYQLINFFFIDS